MRFNRNHLIPTAIFIFAVSFAFAFLSTFDPFYELLFAQPDSSYVPDSLDNSPPPNIKDVGQMFNERGYYKSNSFSFDENEIINDFNGNLMYEVPLYNYKAGGNIPFDVKLTYNGSVGHQVFIGDTSSYNASAIPGRHNVNAPEWILSINGMAVQVMNFETNFFSHPGESNEITGGELNMLIPGYHFDDRLLPAFTSDPDRINILAGDGSVITLVNNHPVTDSVYIGVYEYEGKELNYIAKVTYLEFTGDQSYRNRRVELMKGDGLVYIYEERKQKFADFNIPNSFVNTRRKPQMLLLKEIRDQVGNFISLAYDGVPLAMENYIYGRPLLSTITIPGSLSLDAIYGPTLIRFGGYTNINGPYSLSFTDQIDYHSGVHNHTTMISKIKNINQQEAIIAYGSYNRKYTSSPNPIHTSTPLTLEFNHLKRITSFKNFLGGRRGYEYLDGGGNTLTIDLTEIANVYKKSSIYNGYGRDAFYTNTLSYRKDTLSGIQKSQHQFNYNFDCGRGAACSTQAVDSNDIYTTTRIIESSDTSTVNSSADYIRNVKIYKVYPLKSVTPMEDKIDVSGSTKLVTEFIYDTTNNSENDFEMKNTYNYEKGSWENGGLTGSLLMTQKTNTYPGLSGPRIWNYEYQYLSSNPDRPVVFKRETDPKGIKFETSYDTFAIPIAFKEYGLVFYKHMFVYKIDVPKLEEKYEGATKIFKKEYTYIHDTVTATGYYGQLKSEKVFNENSFSTGITTDYEYYKKDSTGRFMYLEELPNVESNLKIIKNPDGQEERYYYYPISPGENKFDPPDYNEDFPPRPKVSYKIKYYNESVQSKSLFISDSRLPSRITRLKRTGPTTADTLSTVYMMYNEAGDPRMIINENNYLTELLYQPSHRIHSITLPGDFNTDPNDTLEIVYPNSFQDSAIVLTDGWGHLTNSTGNVTAKYTDDPWKLTPPPFNCPSFFMYKSFSSEGTQNYPAYLQFDNSVIKSFSEIDSAFLYIAPIKYEHYLLANHDSTPSNFITSVKPVSGLSNRTGQDFCYQRNATISSGTNVTISAPNGSSCVFFPHTLDITSIMSQSVNALAISGTISPTIPEEGPNYHYIKMDFAYCTVFNPQSWLENYRPYIKIYGTRNLSDTLKIENTNGGTYLYHYNDTNNTINVLSRLTSGAAEKFKIVRSRLDGFGNVKQKDIFKTSTTYDSLQYKFDFMNNPSRTIDALNNMTKLSYDELNRSERTDNPAMNGRTSNTASAYSYQNSLSVYFGTTYSGFVEKQTFIDETGRPFAKYFDAVGNLLREEKFVAGDGSGNIQNEDNPYDPDTTFGGQDIPGQTITLATDYQYDRMYRLVKVKTPDSLFITYSYDGYGRQIQRVTPDASYSKYTYDNNGNLMYTQDAKQRAASATKWTQRAYDALNRLLIIGEVNKTSGLPHDENSGPVEDTTTPVLELDASGLSIDSIYTINVYDTLTTAVFNIFSSKKPADYNSAPNFTKGNLIATAYRTRFADSMSYKFYRYDARGNIIKMWNYIWGLGWKSEVYNHNSQNQLTRNWYQPSAGYYDSKMFTYGYDDAARLHYTNLYVGSTPEEPDEETDSPGDYYTLTRYSYNQNSQVDTHKVNNNRVITKHHYNGRNWLQYTSQSPGPIFRYVLDYNLNGNIRYQDLQGTYNDNFSLTDNVQFLYTYDESNRLTKANETRLSDTSAFTLINSYDRDGNLNSMKRYGSGNNLVDNYSYQYFSGTNKLQKVGGGIIDDYTYDANGNMTTDEINRNSGLIYDYRNLLTDIRTVRPAGGLLPDITYYTKYWYDDAGNRIRKQQWEYTGEDPDPVYSEEDAPGTWVLQFNEFYVRDIAGKEIAVYTDTTLQFWNIWGIDNIGKINSDTTKHYYLKDHLGSIRAVTNSTNTLVSAQDFDAWGHPLQNRTYNATSIKYDYTGKERDNETNYDYFGARFYDSRIANWGSIDPLFEKHNDFTPYNYVVRNPLRFIDPDGMQKDRVLGVSEGGPAGLDDIGPLPGSSYGSGSRSVTSTNVVKSVTNPTTTPQFRSIGSSDPMLMGPPPGVNIFNRVTWVIQSTKGSIGELNLGTLQGVEVTKESTKILINTIKGFLKDIPNMVSFNLKQSRVKLGDINKFGKEVRIGRDKSKPFQHIDIERNVEGKNFKDLKIRISTNPLKL